MTATKISQLGTHRLLDLGILAGFVAATAWAVRDVTTEYQLRGFFLVGVVYVAFAAISCAITLAYYKTCTGAQPAHRLRFFVLALYPAPIVFSLEVHPWSL